MSDKEAGRGRETKSSLTPSTRRPLDTARYHYRHESGLAQDQISSRLGSMAFTPSENSAEPSTEQATQRRPSRILAPRLVSDTSRGQENLHPRTRPRHDGPAGQETISTVSQEAGPSPSRVPETHQYPALHKVLQKVEALQNNAKELQQFVITKLSSENRKTFEKEMKQYQRETTSTASQEAGLSSSRVPEAHQYPTLHKVLQKVEALQNNAKELRQFVITELSPENRETFEKEMKQYQQKGQEVSFQDSKTEQTSTNNKKIGKKQRSTDPSGRSTTPEGEPPPSGIDFATTHRTDTNTHTINHASGYGERWFEQKQIEKAGLQDKVRSLEPPDNSFNCHNLTFHDGRFHKMDMKVLTDYINKNFKLLGSRDIYKQNTLLYKELADRIEKNKRENNGRVLHYIAIYKKDGKIVHSSPIQNVYQRKNDEYSIIVWGKWGMGSILEHDIETVPPNYKDKGEAKWEIYYTDRTNGRIMDL